MDTIKYWLKLFLFKSISFQKESLKLTLIESLLTFTIIYFLISFAILGIFIFSYFFINTNNNRIPDYFLYDTILNIIRALSIGLYAGIYCILIARLILKIEPIKIKNNSSFIKPILSLSFGAISGFIFAIGLVQLSQGTFGGFLGGIFGGISAGIFGGFLHTILLGFTPFLNRSLLTASIGGIVGAIFTNYMGGILGGVISGLISYYEKPSTASLLGIISTTIIVLIYTLLNLNSFSITNTQIQQYFLTLLPTYLIVYFKLYYIPIYLIQLILAKKSRNPFNILHLSPLYLDELINIPLPYLENWLIYLLNKNEQKGLAEILYIVNKNSRYKTLAHNALFKYLTQNLVLINEFPDFKKIDIFLKKYYFQDNSLLLEPSILYQLLDDISQSFKEYLFLSQSNFKLKALNDIINSIEKLQGEIYLTPAPIGSFFESESKKWLMICEQEKLVLIKGNNLTILDNPYIFGNPLKKKDQKVFFGRESLIKEIEDSLFSSNKNASLLLYGKRRTGKSSILLNLPHNSFEIIYIDCQDSKWSESDQAFCYNLAKSLYNILQKNNLNLSSEKPKLVDFFENSFTKLDTIIEEITNLWQQKYKKILLAFDEYEALGIANKRGDITDKVFGKLRNFTQHNDNIFIILAGSHKFTELLDINWSNYLINTKIIEVGFLSRNDVVKLITQPVVNLKINEYFIEKIISITNYQPYLTQAFLHILITKLNEYNSFIINEKIFNETQERILVASSGYFTDLWMNNTDKEKQILINIAKNSKKNTYNDELILLYEKELISKKNNITDIHLKLFKLWIIKNFTN